MVMRVPTRPSGVAPDNRRVHERVELGGHLEIQLVGQATWWSVYARDVSSGGFGFVTEVKLDKGDCLMVNLRDPAGPTTVEAIVRHVHQEHRMYSVGVEFSVALSDDQVERIQSSH